MNLKLNLIELNYGKRKTFVLEVQKGLGLVKFAKSLAKKKNWNLEILIENIVQWTSVEMTDLRFDITTRNAEIDEETADLYRKQFALQVLQSSFSVLDEDVFLILEQIAKEFSSGNVYENFLMETRRVKEPSILGIVGGTLIALGANITSGILWMEHLPYNASFWYGYGGFMASLVVPPIVAGL